MGPNGCDGFSPYSGDLVGRRPGTGGGLELRSVAGVGLRHRRELRDRVRSGSATSDCARHVGRVGALAVVLGVGAAIASMPAIAGADSSGSSGSSASSSAGSSSGARGHDAAGHAGGGRRVASRPGPSNGPAGSGAAVAESTDSGAGTRSDPKAAGRLNAVAVTGSQSHRGVGPAARSSRRGSDALSLTDTNGGRAIPPAAVVSAAALGGGPQTAPSHPESPVAAPGRWLWLHLQPRVLR